MLYVDYTFDISDQGIILDQDMHLNESEGKGWGKLPDTWSEGDTFQLTKLPTGRVALVRTSKDK